MDWSNDCIKNICTFEDCKEIKTVLPDKTTHVDKNCFIKTCEEDPISCDSKVFITWVGNDSSGRWCESDNFRITNLIDHGIRTYFQSARLIASQTLNP